MSTKVALNGRMKGQTSEALDRLAEQLYENSHRRPIGIVEFAVHNGGWNDPDKTERVVRIGIAGCEIAAGDQEHVLRSAMQALHMERTATGTFDEQGLQYSQQVLDQLPGLLDATEAVRLHVALDFFVTKLTSLGRSSKLDDGSLRRDVKTLAAMARQVLSGQQLSLDDATKAKAAFVAAAADVADDESAQLATAQQRLDETTSGVPDPLGDSDDAANES